MEDSDILSQTFDFVVVGTGLTESLLAAALAQSGKSVIHLDRNSFYGCESASFSFDQFIEWLVSQGAGSGDEDDALPGAGVGETDHSEGAIPGPLEPLVAPRDALFEALVPPPVSDRVAATSDRRFMVDLQPRVTLARGSLVDLLSATGLGDHLEFRTCDTVLMSGGEAPSGSPDAHAGRPAPPSRVPCSKADIFQAKGLSLLEKRRLMKFLQFCQDFHTRSVAGGAVETRNEEGLGQSRSLTRPQNKSSATFDYEAFEARPFREFLEDACGLSEAATGIIMHAVALLVNPQGKEAGTRRSPDDGAAGAGGTGTAADRACVATAEGMRAIMRYISSLGRFGTTAFIQSMYGVSEIPQAFCRMCAVYGGVYLLGKPVSSLVLAAEEATGGAAAPSTADRRVQGVVLEGKKFLRARNVILAPQYADQFVRPRQRIMRVVAIVSSRLTTDADRAFLVVPPGSAAYDNPHAVHVIQQDSRCCAAPEGKFVLYLSTPEAAADDAYPLSEDHPAVLVLRRVLAGLTRGVDPPIGPATEEESGGGATGVAHDADAASPEGGEDHDSPTMSVSSASHLAEDLDSRPQLLWSAVFAQRTSYVRASLLPRNVTVTAPSERTEEAKVCAALSEESALQAHAEDSIALARHYFEQLCPEMPFFPRRQRPTEDDDVDDVPSEPPAADDTVAPSKGAGSGGVPKGSQADVSIGESPDGATASVPGEPAPTHGGQLPGEGDGGARRGTEAGGGSSEAAAGATGLAVTGDDVASDEEIERGSP